MSWIQARFFVGSGLLICSDSCVTFLVLFTFVLNLFLNVACASRLSIKFSLIWLKSYLSLAPLYWYVEAWDIWWNPITGHMRMSDPIYHQMEIANYETVTKLHCLLRSIRSEKTPIYHIIIYSWHKVTHKIP